MFNHREAYCLMRYATDDYSFEEVLWNSRDGVTPFIIMSADRKHELRHVDWALDEQRPLYVPPVGSRIFVDLTREKALEYAAAQVERQWEQGMKNHFHLGPMGKEGAAQQLAQSIAQQPGTPDIIVVHPLIRDFYYRQRALNDEARRTLGGRFE